MQATFLFHLLTAGVTYEEIVIISLINTSINMLSFSRMADKPYLCCLYNNLLENVEHCGGEPEQAATMATHE